jgi:hypothetical protein
MRQDGKQHHPDHGDPPIQMREFVKGKCDPIKSDQGKDKSAGKTTEENVSEPALSTPENPQGHKAKE